MTERDKTLEALHTAVKMEIDGKKYYLKVSQESSNELGQKLFQSLATEEDIHRKKFENIYNAIRDKKAWPVIAPHLDAGKELKTVFSRASEGITPEFEAPASELSAVKAAMEMENKTRDFYENQGHKATYVAEKKFYVALAAEERGHYLALVDYREYLIEPAGWFLKAEHHSLDGG